MLLCHESWPAGLELSSPPPCRWAPTGLGLTHIHVPVHGQQAAPGPGCIIPVGEYGQGWGGAWEGGPGPGRPGGPAVLSGWAPSVF